MVSSDQPCDSATPCSSNFDSERVTYRQRSPARVPSNRNWSASVVLPVPGSPSRRYRWLEGKPPPRMSSSPSLPLFRRTSLLRTLLERVPIVTTSPCNTCRVQRLAPVMNEHYFGSCCGRGNDRIAVEAPQCSDLRISDVQSFALRGRID